MKLIYALFLLAGPAFAGDGYGSCYVKDGVAHAFFCSKTSDSASGTGRITAFDRDGDEVFEDNIVIWIGIAISGCDEVDQEEVPSEAVGCIFELDNGR